MTSPAHEKLTFLRIGGAWQPVVTGFRDFPALLELDAAHWGMTGIAVDLLRTDKNFLACLDSDGDGQIRVNEIRDALKFMISVFADGSGMDARSDVLKLAHLDTADADAGKIRDAARAVLLTLGTPDAAELKLADLLNDMALKSRAVCNGDGVLSAAGVGKNTLAAMVELIIRYAGGTTDLSGEPGIDGAAIDRLEERYQAWCAWKKLDVFAPEDAAMFTAAGKLADALDTYFLNSEAMAFLADDPERLKPCTIAADIRSISDVSDALTRLVIAAPDAAGELDTAAQVNPLYRESLTALFGMAAFQPYLTAGKLTAAAWRKFQAERKKYADFTAARPETVFSDDDAAVLAKPVTARHLKELRDLAAADLAVGKARSGEHLLLKAMLYQKYLLDFLNNFINLSELFRPEGLCMLQNGTLIMDGRRFTLAVPVKNLAEHRSIAATGNICVAYIEITRKLAAAEKRQLAVAITSGSMRNLFVGKRGVFFSADGEEYDARIVQFLDAPVSISDALRAPFCKFGSFVGKQMDKFFATRASDAQKTLGAELSTGHIPPPANNSAVSGSMLLMGGGVGLAALGSSLAFMVKSLQNVSALSVIVILLGIVLIFGGPGVVVALFRLYRRNLARFFEASGCALNRNLRMSFALGRSFTCEPHRPAGSKMAILPHLAEAESRGRRRLIRLLLLAVVIAGAIAFGIWWKFYRVTPEPAPVPAAAPVETAAPAEVPAAR